MNGSFEFTLTAADYLTAHRLHLRKLWLWRRLIRYYAMAVVLYFVLMTIMETWDRGLASTMIVENLFNAMLWSVVLIPIIIGITLTLMPYRIRRMFHQLKFDDRPTQFDFDENGIRLANRDGTGNFDWGRFSAWAENDRTMILVLGDDAFLAFPKDKIERVQLDKLLSLLTSAGVRAI